MKRQASILVYFEKIPWKLYPESLERGRYRGLIAVPFTAAKGIDMITEGPKSTLDKFVSQNPHIKDQVSPPVLAS